MFIAEACNLIGSHIWRLVLKNLEKMTGEQESIEGFSFVYAGGSKQIDFTCKQVIDGLPLAIPV